MSAESFVGVKVLSAKGFGVVIWSPSPGRKSGRSFGFCAVPVRIPQRNITRVHWNHPFRRVRQRPAQTGEHRRKVLSAKGFAGERFCRWKVLLVRGLEVRAPPKYRAP